jgi:hypothetical protein
LCTFNLFIFDKNPQKTGEKFSSERVLKNLKERALKSAQGKLAAEVRWGNADAMREHTGRNAIKERKGKKEKDSISAPEKFKFLDHVFLTKTERDSLTEKLGEKNSRDYIERLNNYIGSKGAKYRSHYHTILNWANKDGVRAPKKEEKPIWLKKEADPEQMEKISELISQTARDMK